MRHKDVDVRDANHGTHMCTVLTGDQTCPLILQRAQTVVASPHPAKVDKASDFVGPSRRLRRRFPNESSDRKNLATGGIQPG